GEHNDHSQHDVLNGILQSQLRASATDDGHDGRSRQCAEDGAAPAVQTAAADDDGGDNLEFETGPGRGLAGGESGEMEQAGDADEQSRDGVDGDLVEGDVDAAKPRGGFVGAECEDVPAEDGVPQHQAEREGEQHRQPHAQRQSAEQDMRIDLDFAPEVIGANAEEVAHQLGNLRVGVRADRGRVREDFGDAQEDGHGSEGDDKGDHAQIAD